MVVEWALVNEHSYYFIAMVLSQLTTYFHTTVTAAEQKTSRETLFRPHFHSRGPGRCLISILSYGYLKKILRAYIKCCKSATDNALTPRLSLYTIFRATFPMPKEALYVSNILVVSSMYSWWYLAMSSSEGLSVAGGRTMGGPTTLINSVGLAGPIGAFHTPKNIIGSAL